MFRDKRKGCPLKIVAIKTIIVRNLYKEIDTKSETVIFNIQSVLCFRAVYFGVLILANI